MMKIEMNEEQLKSLLDATDIVSRLYCGQIKELGRISKNNIPDHVFKILKEYMFPELDKHGYYGITNKKTPEIAKILYDIHQVIRHYLAWKDHENTSDNRDWSKQITVDFDKPMQTSNEPLPKVET